MNVPTFSPWEASQFATEIGAQVRHLNLGGGRLWRELATFCTDSTFASDRETRLIYARMAACRSRYFGSFAYLRPVSAHYRALALVLFAAARWQPLTP